ncbi:hypothetical protein [Citreimonas sp.]|uniref:hypothetical protein n=1 Tax=Citreimonas sp. TaxID=3036715 RepID=UPI0040594269
MSDILDRLRAARENATTIPIEVEAWGVTAYIKPISAAKHASIRKEKSESRMAAKFMIACLMDKEGKSLFEDNAETLAELESQDAGLVGWVLEKILEAMDARFDQAKNS